MIRLASLAGIACLAVLPAAAGEIARSAGSSIRVESLPDGVISTEIRNATFTTYGVFREDVYLNRIALIESRTLSRTDAEGDSPESAVAITVEDAATGVRLARIEAPGSAGGVPDPGVAVISQYGCCGAPNTLRVYNSETGRFLYRATGAEPYGSSSWAAAPNGRPDILRWAAYSRAETGEGEDAPESPRIGTLVYGGPDGPISAVDVLRRPDQGGKDQEMEAEETDLAMDAENGAIHWLGAEPIDGGRPGTPATVWPLDGLTDAMRFGGVSVALVAAGKTLVSIPVAGDRLVPADARTSPYVTIAPARPPAP